MKNKFSVCNDTNASYVKNAPSCNLNCETLGNNCQEKTVRKPGCYCNDNHVKDCNGKCVLAKQYCKVCGENEYYSDCMAIPEKTCLNPNQECTGPAAGCSCRTGFVRDYNGKCVSPKTCPSNIFRIQIIF